MSLLYDNIKKHYNFFIFEFCISILSRGRGVRTGYARAGNYLRIELIVPTTAATGRRAGTNVAATGRILFATGRAFITAGKAFLVNQLFW
jgi:hypothetical protein